MADDALFPALYVKHNCDGIAALRACGFEGNHNSLRSLAEELLMRPEVQSQLYEIRQALQMDASETLQRLGEIARGGALDDVITESGEIDIEGARASGRLWMIQEYKVTETQHGTNRSVKTYSVLEALKIIAKHHGLLDSIFSGRKAPRDLREINEALRRKGFEIVRNTTAGPES